jgi:hypothetical protein
MREYACNFPAILRHNACNLANIRPIDPNQSAKTLFSKKKHHQYSCGMIKIRPELVKLSMSCLFTKKGTVPVPTPTEYRVILSQSHGKGHSHSHRSVVDHFIRTQPSGLSKFHE